MTNDIEKQLGGSPRLESARGKIKAVIEKAMVVATKGGRPTTRSIKQSWIVRILVLIVVGYVIFMLSVYTTIDDYTETMKDSLSLFSGEDSDLSPSGYSGQPVAAHLTPSGFDGAAVVARLLNHPKEEPFGFNWNQWIDLSIVENDPANSSETIWSWFKDDITKIEEVKFPPKGGKPDTQQAAVGKLYLANYMPSPNRIVVLGQPEATYTVAAAPDRVHFDYAEEELQTAAEEQANKEQNREGGDENSKVKRELKIAGQYPIGKPLVPVLKGGTPEERVAVELKPEMFMLDLDKLETVDDNSTDADIKHANMIKNARARVSQSGKHFNEVPLSGEGAAAGSHYDWRFFNKLRKGEDHKAFMHHMIRAWSNFVEQEGIASWIAHGSLLGWYWNGLAMPWDSDNDVQMPIMELDRFAKYYNGTLVVENPEEGTGRYYIDVSPWYVERVRGNGRNVIDARFIDIRSGIYIDITGLAVTDDPNGRVNCKNRHYYTQRQLSPMRKTLYEGVRTYIPNSFDMILQDEYKKYRLAAHADWLFNRNLQLWVPRSKCKNFKDMKKFFDEDYQLTMYGACNDESILEEFVNTRNVTSAHMRERALFEQMDLDEIDKEVVYVDTDRSRKLAVDAIQGYYRPLRYDPSFEREDN